METAQFPLDFALKRKKVDRNIKDKCDKSPWRPGG